MADYFGTDTVVSELREDGLLIINIMNHAETDKAVRAIVVTGTG